MEVLCLKGLSGCFYQDLSDRPQIEIQRYEKGQRSEVFINANEIIFFLKGTIRQVFRDYPPCVVSAGHFIFLPCGGKVSLQAIEESVVTVFRLDKPLHFCWGYPMETLYEPGEGDDVPPRFGILPMEEHVTHFLEGVNRFVLGGLCCRYFSDLKIREFFLMFRMCYTREEVKDFFRLVLCADTVFSEYVRANWGRYPSAKLMALSLNMTVKQFSLKFKQVFGDTAYRWIKREKAANIHHQLLMSNKPFKQIADDNGFATTSQFTNFCKKELGATPSQIRDRSRFTGLFSSGNCETGEQPNR